MKRLFTLVLAAFIFAFTAPVAMHNAAAQGDDAATSATDDAMKGEHHGSPANENNKTNKDHGRKHPGHHKAAAHHKHKHMHKKAKAADEGADTTGK